ncbi:MAG: ATP-binding protein [Methanomassiliicoccaceae archaeon]|nr:ATP-binding protein [Methanomassiliicoccaceae archaeon]
MKRSIYDSLLMWKEKKGRKPLLLEGVRQCGKTYILKEFGKRDYKDTAYFNFEDTPGLCDVFQPDLDTGRIISRLSLELGRKIEPGGTLVILDEIQSCNRAITSLKYFCENAPEYHIACAGSLLGVMISKPYSFPIGKVDMMRMGPMSFKEFLWANSEEYLVDFIEGNDPTEMLPTTLADRLGTYLDYYFVVGGMPAAVEAWVKDKDISKVEEVLDGIIRGYTKDFSKHASESLSKLTQIWESIPVQLAKENKKFAFGHVKAGARANDLEDALRWLINAGLVHKVSLVPHPAVPLSMNASATNFKIYMADIGVLRRMSRLPPNFSFSKDKKLDAYRGMIAENYVLSEIVSSTGDVPYYWRSDGIAEVDFIMQIGMEAVPIEVKAGDNRSKSLSEYIQRYSPRVAVVASARKSRGEVVNNIPLYLAWRIPDHIQGKLSETDVAGSEHE